MNLCLDFSWDYNGIRIEIGLHNLGFYLFFYHNFDLDWDYDKEYISEWDWGRILVWTLIFIWIGLKTLIIIGIIIRIDIYIKIVMTKKWDYH